MRELVARFWEWYEAAPTEEKAQFADADDYGRSQPVDISAWNVTGPVVEAGNDVWYAYPAGLTVIPDQERMVRAESRERLQQIMGGFESQARAWTRSEGSGTAQ
jgi:hypothetical protein